MDSNWVMEQSKTSHHKMAIYLLPLVVFLGFLHPALFIIGIVIFFLLTSFKMLKSMLLWVIILGVISLVLPFLAPIIFIIMIVLFFLRIGYVLQNWRPILAGILLYGMAFILISRSFDLFDSNHGELLVDTITEGLAMSVLSYFLLRHLLKWLYEFNYTSYAALGIMGSAPVIIITFVLPFLKLHIGSDFFTTETPIETKPLAGQATVTASEVYSSRTIVSAIQNYMYVDEHIRTAPDGDITNNLSYNGPDKTAPSDDLVTVKSHLKTSTDADLTNNFSYRDPLIVEETSINTNLETSTKDKLIENTQVTITGQVAIVRLIDVLKKQQNKKEV
ncbi:hypothetical protein [Psychrobacillus sp. MER TA 171]|uniref:hypothetical protein n=1 Tax=Psychrobacillus sp. MER TA 171 TaxID=2939577 RepID=UPI00203D2578|nr:hypothetical protein [Psychrobacillus sp. MER TA 171]MCM3356569.1 hypothetical protein [Psychrobacillus sp. MER TA 171]